MFKSISLSFNSLKLKDKIHYLFLLIGRSISSFLDVLGILAIGLTISALTSNGTKYVSIIGHEVNVASQDSIKLLALFVLIVFTIKGVTGIAFTAATTRLFTRLEISKVNELISGYFSGDLKSMQKISRGEVQHSLSGSTQASLGGTLTPFSILISELSLLIYVTATYFFVNWGMALVTMLYFLLVGTIILQITAKYQKRSLKKMIDDLQMSQNVLVGMLDTYREIFVTGTQRHFINNFLEKRVGQARYSGLMNLLGVIPRYILELALVIGLFIILTFNEVFLRTDASIAELGVFLAGAMRIVASMVPLQNSVNSIRGAAQEAEASRVLSSLLINTQNSEPVSQSKILNIKGETQPLKVHASGVYYGHNGPNEPLLNNIDLEISPGEFVAIVGPSGAGKTTLVDLLLGLLKPQKGYCKIDNIESSAFIHNCPGLVSYVPQRPGLIDGNIIENIALGVPPEEIDLDRVHEAIRMANLEDFIANRDGGVFSTIGKQKDTLSGGQIQRLGLARAFYNKPKLLVLDEATSALDAISESWISEIISGLNGNVTVIIIAHRLSTVKAADKIFMMENGSITESGSFSELVRKSPTFSEFVKLMNVTPAE